MDVYSVKVHYKRHACSRCGGTVLYYEPPTEDARCLMCGHIEAYAVRNKRVARGSAKGGIQKGDKTSVEVRWAELMRAELEKTREKREAKNGVCAIADGLDNKHV